MYKKGIIWLYIYLMAGLADIAMIVQSQDPLRYFTKPLILFSLTCYFFSISTVIRNSLLRKSVAAALLFSLAGDILGLFPLLFLYGMGAYMIAHICYIIAFKLTQDHKFNLYKVNFISMFLYNLPIYILAALLYFLIHSRLNQLHTPVIIHILVMVMMVSTARERFKRTSLLSFTQVFLGALLLMVSESILALHLFFRPVPNVEVLVMGSYILAQLLIVMGIRSHLVDMAATKMK